MFALTTAAAGFAVAASAHIFGAVGAGAPVETAQVQVTSAQVQTVAAVWATTHTYISTATVRPVA